MKRFLLFAGCFVEGLHANAAPTTSEIFYYNHPDFSEWGLFFETGNQLQLHTIEAGRDGDSLITGLYTSVDWEEADPYHLPDDWYVSSWLYSVSSDGALNWSQEFHSSVHSFLGIKDAIPTATGTILVGSYRQPDLHYDLWVALTDTAGEIVQEYTWDLGLPEPDPEEPEEWMNVIHGTQILATGGDHEYLIGGYYSVNANYNAGFLFAFDAFTGEEIWRRGIVETGASWAIPIIRTCKQVPGGGYILATSFGIHRLDAGGDLIWSYDIGSEFRKALPITGGFAVLGPDNRFTLLDTDGDLVSEQTLGSLEKEINLVDFESLSDGFVFCGSARWLIYDDRDVLLFRTDALGNERYSYPIGNRNDEAASTMRLTETGDRAIIEAVATCADGETYPWILEIELDHNRPVASVVIESPTTYTPFVEESVTFDGTASNDPDGVLNWYYWDWGDGTTSNSPVMNNPTHFFQKTGDLTVTLRVRDNEGIETTTTIPITVLPWAEQWSRIVGTGISKGMNYLVKIDEGYAMAGFYGSSPQIVKFMRLDERGVLIPDSVRGYPNPDHPTQDTLPTDLQRTPDGGYILTCIKKNATRTVHNLRLLKLDSNGDKEWDRIFDSDLSNQGTSVHALDDGSGYVITGWKQKEMEGSGVENHIWFLRTNSDASAIVAERNDYEIDPDYDYGLLSYTSFACADGSGYILDLNSSSVRSPYEFMKVDPMGIELWRTAFDYETNSYNLIIRLAEGSEGEIYVSGESQDGSFIGQFTEEDSIVTNDWTLSPMTEGWWWAGIDRIIPRAGGGLFVLNRGEVASFVHRVELGRINPEGELLWTHVYDENGFDTESPGASVLIDDKKLVLSSSYQSGSTRAKRVFMLAPNHRPVAAFSLPSGAVYAGRAFTLDASASTDVDGDEGALTYSWYLPGTGVVNKNDPISSDFTIAFAGSQTIILTVIDADGGEDTVEHTLTVLEAPSGCSVEFSATGPGSLTGTTSQFVAVGEDASPVEAVPNAGYYFTFWGADLFTSDNPLTIENVTRDITTEAHFMAIPDAWFTAHGLTPSPEAVVADSDLDRALNWEEYIAGTDPTNPHDRFVIEELEFPGGIDVITCESALGRTYSLYYANDFGADLWQFHSTQSGTGDLLSFDISALSGDPWFFRLLVELAP